METTQALDDAFRLVIGTARQLVKCADEFMPDPEAGWAGVEDWRGIVGESLQSHEEVLELFGKISEESDEQRQQDLLKEFSDRCEHRRSIEMGW